MKNVFFSERTKMIKAIPKRPGAGLYKRKKKYYKTWFCVFARIGGYIISRVRLVKEYVSQGCISTK